MSAPQRIQLRRTKGWRKPENTVLVSRPSVLGNPFHIMKEPTKPTTWSVHYVPHPLVDCGRGGFVNDDIATRAEAIRLAVDVYREWATSGPNHYMRVQYFVDEWRLSGKNLACWCPLDQPCHADVLLDLANGAA